MTTCWQARTSALFQLDCGELGTRTLPGQAVYGLEHSNGGLITFPGGVALRSDQARLKVRQYKVLMSSGAGLETSSEPSESPEEPWRRTWRSPGQLLLPWLLCRLETGEGQLHRNYTEIFQYKNKYYK